MSIQSEREAKLSRNAGYEQSGTLSHNAPDKFAFLMELILSF